ncbi:histone-lysine N-methyltransferase SETMAR-like [Euwallacea fornicatus]|uniref:histone-lysine N-methyltransferase SETMAR-like n=1 Tax=Euwallacea fornicatus TaxID=995702 RepID=UPI00338FC848
MTPFIDCIVRCDEKWVLYDNHRSSARWSDHDQAPQHFPQPHLHQREVAAKPSRQRDIVSKLTTCIENYGVSPRHWSTGPILLHDNARPHAGQSTPQKLNDLSYETLPHPPYSPGLSPPDRHFFRHLDHFPREKCFKNQEDAKNTFDDFMFVYWTSPLFDMGTRFRVEFGILTEITSNKATTRK